MGVGKEGTAGSTAGENCGARGFCVYMLFSVLSSVFKIKCRGARLPVQRAASRQLDIHSRNSILEHCLHKPVRLTIDNHDTPHNIICVIVYAGYILS